MTMLRSRIQDFQAFVTEFLFASRWTIPLILFVLIATHGRWLVGVCYTNDQILSLHSEPLFLIEQQRWGMTLLALLGLVDRYIPFWSTFIGLGILLFAGLLFVYFWHFVSESRVSHWQSLLTLLLFLIYPLNCEIFIYPAAIIWNAVSYAVVAVTLILAWEPSSRISEKSMLAPRPWPVAVLCLATAVAIYESFLFVYISCICLAVLITLRQSPSTSWRDVFMLARKPAVVLVGALLIRWVIISLIGLFVTYAQNGGGAAKAITWLEIGSFNDLLRCCVRLLAKVLFDYLAYAPFNIALLLFWIAVVGGYFVFQRKGVRALVTVLVLAWIVSLFGITVIMGSVQPYRNCQAFAPCVAFVIAYLLTRTPRWRLLRYILSITAIFLCTKQAALFFDADLRAWHLASLRNAVFAEAIRANGCLDRGKPIYIVGTHHDTPTLSDTLAPTVLASRFKALLNHPYQHAGWTYSLGSGLQGRVILRDLYDLPNIPLRNPDDLSDEALQELIRSKQIPAFPTPGFVYEDSEKVIIHAAEPRYIKPWRERVSGILNSLKGLSDM